MTQTAPSPEAASSEAASGDVAPVLADGVELLGELANSGYRSAPSLVRRADGQTISLTPLLYQVLAAIDGTRGDVGIAEEVGRNTGRQVSAADVAHLVETKLRPLGVLSNSDGSTPTSTKANPLLALRFRYVVSDPAKTRRMTAPFAVLFRPAFVVVFTLLFVAIATWVIFEKGLASAAHQALHEPGLLLLVFAVTAVSAGFHEFGHAAACRYSGATPGAMGAGLYLVWPAFYTEVSDSYRLSRGGRLRVDLGGLYFNALFAVATYAAWAWTRWDALLLVIGTQLLQMLRQLAPFVRFDGYHILADLVGVPDLFGHIKPSLLGLLPTRWHRPESKALQPWARAVVTLWVLVVLPALLFSFVMMVVALPRVAATTWQSLTLHWADIRAAWAGGNLARVGAGTLSVLVLVLTLLAMLYLLYRIVRRTSARVWTSTRGRPWHRSAAALTAAVLVAGLAWAWWPSEDKYRPIQANESGTLLDGLRTTASTSTSSTALPPPILHQGQTGTQPHSIWASAGRPPTKDHPQLAMILVPHDAGTTDSSSPSSTTQAATWVFPFNPPDAPGPGDNQALAVNTQDGSTVYDVAFALVWDTDGQATNDNSAYALASCNNCTTVAVGFQVVIVIGQADLVMPTNVAVAVNYSCVACMTYALATQLVITLPHELSDDAMAQLQALWAQVAQLAAHIEDIPLDQLQATLTNIESQVLAIVAEEGGAQLMPSPSASATGSGPATTSSSSTAPRPGTSAQPGDGATSPPAAGSGTVESPSSRPTASTSPSPETSAPSPTATSATSTTTP
jgi:putative peptide zinc metalloprotease protein